MVLFSLSKKGEAFNNHDHCSLKYLSPLSRTYFWFLNSRSRIMKKQSAILSINVFCTMQIVEKKQLLLCICVLLSLPSTKCPFHDLFNVQEKSSQTLSEKPMLTPGISSAIYSCRPESFCKRTWNEECLVNRESYTSGRNFGTSALQERMSYKIKTFLLQLLQARFPCSTSRELCVSIRKCLAVTAEGGYRRIICLYMYNR